MVYLRYSCVICVCDVYLLCLVVHMCMVLCDMGDMCVWPV